MRQQAQLKIVPQQKSNSNSVQTKSTTPYTSLGVADLYTKKSDFTRKDIAYLEQLLPIGWHNSFAARRFGKHLGFPIICKKCGTRPPSEIKHGSQRWRWMAAHMITKH